MESVFNLALVVLVIAIGVYAYNLNCKLTNLASSIHTKEKHNSHKKNYLESISGVKRDLMGYLVAKYFNNEIKDLFNAINKAAVNVPDYDTLSYLLDQMARAVGLTYIDAYKCLLFESGYHHATGDSVRFVKLLKTVRGAITGRPIRSNFVFDYEEMTDQECELVIAILSANITRTLSYNSKKDTGKNKVEIKSTLQYNNERLYKLYLDIVAEYKKMLGRNEIFHPGILTFTASNRDLVMSLSIKTGDGHFEKVRYAPDVIVGFLTAYAMIEKQPMQTFCTGNYTLATHIYKIVYQEKRKTTLKAITRV